jgi:hypothetical protein
MLKSCLFKLLGWIVFIGVITGFMWVVMGGPLNWALK